MVYLLIITRMHLKVELRAIYYRNQWKPFHWAFKLHCNTTRYRLLWGLLHQVRSCQVTVDVNPGLKPVNSRQCREGVPVGAVEWKYKFTQFSPGNRLHRTILHREPYREAENWWDQDRPCLVGYSLAHLRVKVVWIFGCIVQLSWLKSGSPRSRQACDHGC